MNAGEMVAGHLRLVRPLDQGSMGSVWVADHTGLNTQVAVKFISASMALDPSYVARFTREAYVTAQIKSIHVVQIFDHGVTPEGVPYIAMELLNGESLQQRIRRIGSLSVAETVEIIKQLCKPMARAHKLGIIHRDIKTANIFLVDSDGDVLVKLLDFGVAKLEKDVLEMTQTGDRVGTPYYMSPEQLLSSKHVDFRTDLWSIGVVAYYCLLGRPPFRADSFSNLVFAVAKGVFPSPGEARPGAFSPLLDEWFRRALLKDPKGRFEGAKQLADAFEQAALGQG